MTIHFFVLKRSAKPSLWISKRHDCLPTRWVTAGVGNTVQPGRNCAQNCRAKTSKLQTVWSVNYNTVSWLIYMQSETAPSANWNTVAICVPAPLQVNKFPSLILVSVFIGNVCSSDDGFGLGSDPFATKYQSIMFRIFFAGFKDGEWRGNGRKTALACWENWGGFDWYYWRPLQQ